MWSERNQQLPPGVPINFWSSSLNNVSWSKDNIIAIGGPEHVAVLVPKPRAPKDDRTKWERVELRVNVFTDDEVPLMLPLSWKALSTGEEQSEAFCSSLAWSPPGLGKHERCVLAVLTANHILSIWECVGRLEIPEDWKRVCIVNHTLKAFAASQEVEGSEAEVAEKRKIRQRIRDFSWSQAPPSSSRDGYAGATTMLSQPYLAVSNDTGEVFILNIETPYDLLSPESSKWNFSIVQSFLVQPIVNKKVTLASCMPCIFQPRELFVDQLAWSPWSWDASGTLTSILSMTTQSTLICRLITAKQATDDVSIELGPVLPRIFGDNSANPSGQMRWMPKPSNDGELFFVYPCRKILYCLVFHLRKAMGIRVTKQPLDNVWDELAGMAFTKNEHDETVLQLTFSIDTVYTKILGWPLPLTDVQPIAVPSWQNSLIEAEKLYGEENRLDGHVATRTYGIDASPLGDMIAINSSCHPTDGIEYVIASDQMSMLNIEPARNVGENEILPVAGGASHASDISAEAMLSSLQQFINHVPQVKVADNVLLSSLLQTLDLTDPPVLPRHQTHITEDTSIRAIVRQVRENVLFRGGSIASRVRQLVRFSQEDVPASMPVDPAVIRDIVTEVVRLPHFISEASDLSQKITHIHCLILAKLDARDGKTHQSDGLSDQDVETCDTCSSSIAFESLRWARCSNGHQFTRCALSFLSIQTPGTAKSCGICNTQYLNEYLIPGMQALCSDHHAENEVDTAKQGASVREPLVSLARVLFSAVDRCVCCGGKFVG